MARVNLDALIPREDFETEAGSASQSLGDKLKISDLVKGHAFFYSSLRKPDFQRETSDWDKEKITAFVKSFLDNDLIPAIILWQAGQYTFVIDGAHRLSALIAWANDDYGDGFISQAFFGHDVDQEQRKVAEQTKRHVNETVGSYKEYMDAIRSPEQANPAILTTAHRLGFISVQLQWVTGGTDKAETSFFTINQKATPISETEISLLRSRKMPHAMASRAILRSGAGHKYWKAFDEQTQRRIEELAREINLSLFTPTMKTPIKTLDLPLAGKGYSSNSLALIFDLVKLANVGSPENDANGKETIRFLTGTNKILRRLTTSHASSLGLHPAVYFYSEKGRYQPTAFMAWIEIIKEFEVGALFDNFTKNREQYESALIKLKQLTNQVTLKYGSSLKGYKQLKDVYLRILSIVSEGKKFEDLTRELKSAYPYLNLEYFGDSPSSPEFSRDTKSEVFISKALETAQRCSICRGYIHLNSMTIDHVTRKQDGGRGVKENGDIAHPYCNTTYKN